MSWTILSVVLDIHGARGQLNDFRTYNNAVNNINRRLRSMARNRNPTRPETQSAVDEFQDARTTRTLRRGRSVARHFSNLARWKPQLPTSERSDAYIAMFEAVRVHGMESRQTWQARERFARIISDYNDTLRDEKDRMSNAVSRLNTIKTYYRNLQQLNNRAADIYGNLSDDRTIRALGDFGETVRRDLVAAHLAFGELWSLCAEIAFYIDRAKKHFNNYQRRLDGAIRDNRSYQPRTASNYQPTRRDQQEMSRMA